MSFFHSFSVNVCPPIWMVGSVYSKRRPVPVDAIVATGYEMLAAGLVLLVVAVLKGETPQLLSGQVVAIPAALATVYLALMGKQLGECLGVGTIRSAAVQGKGQHLLLFESRQQYLSIAAKGEGSPASIEAEIRKAFTPKK
jgi:hypothetical protein